MTGKWSLMALAAVIAIWQAAYFGHVNHWVPLLLTIPVLLLPFGGSYRPDRTVLDALYLGIILDVLLILPAALTGNMKAASITLGPLSVAYPVLFSFLVAGSIGKFAVEPFRERPVIFALLSSVAYIFLLVPAGFFLNTGTIGSLLVYTVSPVIILSIFLSYLYIKTDGNNLSTSVFLSAYNIMVVFGISLVSSQLLFMIWQVVSIVGMMLLSEFIIQGSFLTRRAFRAKRHIYERNSRAGTYTVIGAVAIVVLLIGLPAATHLPEPFMADPTASMEPDIQQGSLLLVCHVQISDLKEGDVLVFHAPWDNSMVYAHEIVSIVHQNGTEYFKTAGINNPVADPALVPASDVMGIVSYHVPYLGYVLIYQYLSMAAVLLVLFVGLMVGSRRY